MKTTFFDPNKFNKIINRGLGLECEAEGGRGGGGCEKNQKINKQGDIY